jgi:signal transduction histidine kinase
MGHVADPLASGGALALTRARLGATATRHLLVVCGLCLGIALLLTAMRGGGFGNHLLYSLCIGLACTAVVDVSRLAFAAVLDSLRRARGQLPLQQVSALYTSIPGALLAMVLGPFLGFRLAEALSGHPPINFFSWELPIVRITLVLGVLGTVIAMALIASMERLASARAQAEAAQRLAAETQLRLLQSQLEPHMLFNTLANLRVLIGLQPQQAQEMLDRLIAFLRATLHASRTPLHPLATEFERVADYLALMAVRMGPRLQVQLDLPDALRAVQVPPMLLQPLVENAIKHGLEPQVAGGLVRVQARRQGDHLQLVVQDTGRGIAGTQPEQPAFAAGSHFGLAQVRERLSTLYGSDARLELAETETHAEGSGERGARRQGSASRPSGVVATLWLPLQAPASATAIAWVPTPADTPTANPCPPP